MPKVKVRPIGSAIQEIMDSGWGYDTLASVGIGKSTVAKMRKSEEVTLATVEKFSAIVEVPVEELIAEEHLDRVKPRVALPYSTHGRSDPNTSVLARRLSGWDYIDINQDLTMATDDWVLGAKVEQLDTVDSIYEALEELANLTDELRPEFDESFSWGYGPSNLILTLKADDDESDASKKQDDEPTDHMSLQHSMLTVIKKIKLINSEPSEYEFEPTTNTYEIHLARAGNSRKTLRDQLSSRKLKKRVVSLFDKLDSLGVEIHYALISTTTEVKREVPEEWRSEYGDFYFSDHEEQLRVYMVAAKPSPSIEITYYDPALAEDKNETETD